MERHTTLKNIFGSSASVKKLKAANRKDEKAKLTI